MSDWLIIVPEATTNEIINPSFEVNVTDGWTNNGMVTFERSTTRARFGVASIRLVANAVADEAISDTVANADAGETWTASCWVWVVAGDFRLRIQENAGGWTNQASVTTALTGQWVYLEVTTTLDGGVTDGRVILQPASVAASEFYVDAVQFEQQTEATTYCDGDQPGCEWTGAAHNGTSYRSGVSRAGGLIEDLQVDYNLDVGAMIATGMAPLDLAVDQYAILPGGQLNSIKVLSSQPTLTGVIRGTPEPTTLLKLHANRQKLINVLKSDAVPETEAGPQPVILRYTGAAVDKEISAHYMAGLEANIVAEMPCWEQNVAIRFVAPDPFWREVGESAQVLDSNDPPRLRYAAGRLRSTGQWDDLNIAADPTTNGTVRAILVASDGTVYFGGNWTGWNALGANTRDFIARYHPATDTWSTVGPDGEFNGAIWALAEAPNGDIIAGGEFTDGVGNKDHISRYTPSTNTWAAMGNPLAGAAAITRVRALEFSANGTLYIGGEFTEWADLGVVANYLVSWTTLGAYVAPWAGGAPSAAVYALTYNKIDGLLYMGGPFATFNGNAALGTAAWDEVGITDVDLDGGFGTAVNAMATTEDGLVYVASPAVPPVSSWNGTAWNPLGGTAFGFVALSMAVGPDGTVYVGGRLSVPGSDLAKYNGSSWVRLDGIVPGAGNPEVLAFATGPLDPVIAANYDLWIGFDRSVVTQIAGTAIATNDGTRTAYPRIVISRAAGGTFANLRQIRNETTGKELLFDYDLLEGETLTIDLEPTNKSIISSFFGSRPDAILPSSDFGEWALLPGANQVTCFVDITGATITAHMVWQDLFWSID